MRIGRRLLIGRVLTAGLALTLVSGCTNPPPPTPPPTPTLTPTRPPVALDPVGVTGIGDVAQGGTSATVLVLRFTETGPTTILPGSGSLQVTLTDHDGRADTLTFTGTPTLEAPDSLGASASLSAPNVLTLSIVDSDPFNREQVTITGLGITASSGAALGTMNATIGGCTGSLAGCTAESGLPSPGNVVPAP